MKIRHWRYDDGREKAFDRKTNTWVDLGEVDDRNRGWHCWVYLDDEFERRRFHNWLTLHVRRGYEAISRFNSGNPMTTLIINDDDEAMKFKEYWSDYFATT
jgi:hypothetical protein